MRTSERRLRVAGVLLGSTTGFMLAATLTGAAVLWAGFILATVLSAAYGVALLWVGRWAERRELDLAFARAAVGTRPLAPDPDLTSDEADSAEPAGAGADTGDAMGRAEAVRFLVGYFVGWLVTPVVILLLALCGNRVDLERYESMRRLLEFQGHWRSKSLRMAGIAAISTVTVVGAAGGSAFASSYTVKAGDDLFQIARANGTSVAQLAALNHIANPNLILAGQTIELSGSTTTAADVSSVYTVRPGDDLWRIASEHGTTVAALAAANHISNPNLILAGSTLTFSGTATAAASAAQAATETPSIQTVATTKPAPAPAPAPAPTPAPAAPAPDAGDVAVHAALAELGVPYEFGGNTPSEGFDCSGLVEFAWAAAGVTIPHYSVAQWDTTTRISADELEPGDIVFYNNGEGGPQPGHEALYIGGGEVVAANHPGTAVQTQSVDWAGVPMGFGRVG